MKARPALERAQAAEVGERGEVEVLGLGHREAPDEEVEEAGVVHVYGGGFRVAGDINACRGLSGRRRAAAAFGGHWALRSRLAPLAPSPPTPSAPPPPATTRHPPHGSDAPENACQFSCLQLPIVRIDYDVLIYIYVVMTKGSGNVLLMLVI